MQQNQKNLHLYLPPKQQKILRQCSSRKKNFHLPCKQGQVRTLIEFVKIVIHLELVVERCTPPPPIQRKGARSIRFESNSPTPHPTCALAHARTHTHTHTHTLSHSLTHSLTLNHIHTISIMCGCCLTVRYTLYLFSPYCNWHILSCKVHCATKG